MNQNAIGRHADLALMREVAEHGGVQGTLHVGICENDPGAIASHLSQGVHPRVVMETLGHSQVASWNQLERWLRRMDALRGAA